MKHTQGPWTIGGELISKAGTAIEIASIWSKCDRRKDAPILKEADANARLIAAAPELLEMCKGALAALTQNKTFPADIAAAKSFLKTAIDKAEGR
jgi:hypothetical protein